MPKGRNEEETDWTAVIARALAFMCLDAADLRDKELVFQANLLMSLGLSRADAAGLLGTSADSLRVMQSRAGKASKGAKRKKSG